MSGKGAEIDGSYVLRRSETDKPHPLCIDGCVYIRQEDKAEYCFQEVSLAQGAEVECEAPTATPSTSTASPTFMSSTGPSMSSKAPTTTKNPTTTGSSTMLPSISTSISSTAPSTSMSSIPPSTIPPLSELHTNATNLISQKENHEQALAEAKAKKTEAHALSSELSNAEIKIDQLIGTSKRFVREEFSNSTAPAISCAEIIEFVHKISEAVKQKLVSAATNYAKRITASTATCNQEERNNLTSKKTLINDAKNSTADIITEITVTITETKHKINTVINQMKDINEYLIQHEASTIDHGTTHLITTQSTIPPSSTTLKSSTMQPSSTGSSTMQPSSTGPSTLQPSSTGPSTMQPSSTTRPSTEITMTTGILFHE